MRIIVLSDTHGNPKVLETILARHADAEACIHLGEGEGEVDLLLSCHPERESTFYAVRGNCEAEVDQMVLDFPIMADYAVIPCGNRIIYATHGHHHNVMTPIPMQPGDILLHGHTHVPAREPIGNENNYINPGSVSIPKENSAHSYMILEDGLAKWKNLYGEVYHELML